MRIDITVPGAELVIKREPHKDINVAKVGMEVRFAEEQGEKGMQASTVTVMES